jgi:hypothetical protein
MVVKLLIDAAHYHGIRLAHLRLIIKNSTCP